MKAWLIARSLLWQNRWLFLLLALWPYAMLAILFVAGRPDPEDTLWILQQECFGGLALVTVTGSTLLGNEQRTRRIITVLSRAVSRPNYLFSLWLAAWLPLVIYAAGFLLSGSVLMGMLHRPAELIFMMALAQLALGAWAGAVSIFWSVLLPQILASIVSIGCVGLAVISGSYGFRGPGRLLQMVLGMSLNSRVGLTMLVPDLGLTLIAGGVWFFATAWIFRRRDLNLTAE